MASVLLILCNCNGEMMQNMLSIQQSYEIDLNCVKGGISFPCNAKVACNSALADSYTYTSNGLLNWRVSFKQACTPHGSLQLMDLCFFTGFIIGCPLFMTAADYVGRKTITMFGLLLIIVFKVLLLVLPFFNFVFLYEFAVGLHIPMTSMMSYVWLSELLP